MRPLAKSALTLASVLAGLAVFFVIRHAMVQGFFTGVSPLSPGVCTAVANGLAGPEDFEIDAAHNAIFVSASNRTGATPNSAPKDGLYLLKLNAPSAPPVKLAGTPADFHPHGISLYRAPDGALTLMAINHRANGGQSIEIYDVLFDGETPRLSQQIATQGGLLVSPNDLAAVAPDKFYATNDHVTRTKLGRFAEDYLLWPHADVVVFNGMSTRIAVQRMALPNGILARGKYLYVTIMNERRLMAFSREDFTGNLTEIGSLSLPARPDNISADAQGNLIIAGQAKPGSAQVFRVKLGADGVPLSYDMLFSDDGTRLNGASVAAIQGGHLFIGSARDSKMLDCQIQK